jgi:outer membrane murein-binding lipoprotein Lpp
VGLLVAALQFRTAVVGGGVAHIDRAQIDKMAAQVSQLTKERDTATAEIDKLRATVAASGGTSGACPDRHTPWQPSAERDKTYPELAEFLKKVGFVIQRDNMQLMAAT